MVDSADTSVCMQYVRYSSARIILCFCHSALESFFDMPE